jgi:hypothetical protein
MGRFGVLSDPGLGPDSYLQRLALLVEQRPASRRRKSLRFDHRRTERKQARRVQGPGLVQDLHPVESASAAILMVAYPETLQGILALRL